jgi:hypothetical protein
MITRTLLLIWLLTFNSISVLAEQSADSSKDNLVSATNSTEIIAPQTNAPKTSSISSISYQQYQQYQQYQRNGFCWP